MGLRAVVSDRADVRDLWRAIKEALVDLQAQALAPLGVPAVGAGIAVKAQIGQIVLVDPTAAALSVTLPLATATMIGQCLVVKNDSASANAITIRGAGADLIDGAATNVIAAARASRTLVVKGAGRWVTV